MRKTIVVLLVFVLVMILSSCANRETSIDNTANKTNTTSKENEVPHESYYIEEAVPCGVSFYEAQERGGFFILKADGSFMPLCVEIVSQTYTKNDNIFMISNYATPPVLQNNEKVVLFSNQSVMNEYFFLPVLKEGYTVPFDFYESNNGIYFMNMMFRNYNGTLVADYDDYQIVNILSHFDKGNNGEIRVCFNNANGIDAKTFYDNETIDLENYCTDSGVGCFSDIIFFTQNFNEKVNVDFYSSTQYCEETFYADIKCYLVDGCAKKDFSQSITGKTYYSGTAIIPEFTKEGYVILNTDSLSNGKYIIANLNNRVVFEVCK